MRRFGHGREACCECALRLLEGGGKFRQLDFQEFQAGLELDRGALVGDHVVECRGDAHEERLHGLVLVPHQIELGGHGERQGLQDRAVACGGGFGIDIGKNGTGIEPDAGRMVRRLRQGLRVDGVMAGRRTAFRAVALDRRRLGYRVGRDRGQHGKALLRCKGTGRRHEAAHAALGLPRRERGAVGIALVKAYIVMRQ